MRFYLQMDKVDNTHEFEYKDLIVRKVQQCDIKNDTKSSSS